MNSKVYITTSIPYVNAAPHVGHAQEFILADTIARLYRLRGDSVVLQTGTDENAFKNVASAKAAGAEPLEFVTANAAKFRRLAGQLQISYGEFIRTTEERHTRGVQHFWRSLKPKDLQVKSYRGLYCQGCEDFYQEKDLPGGLCPDHKTKPNAVEEENTFFRLSQYQARLDHLISTDKIRIVPQFRKNEVLSFIRQGLQDISVTRDAARSGGWGIEVPGKKNQIVYVWIDALVNYLSGQGFGTNDHWKEVWNARTRKIHVIGKNVWKFHAVYWPALLLSAGLPVPDEIIIHGFLTVDGEKISKSLGNSVDPSKVVSSLGPDALRNYLLSHLSLFQDADFSEERLEAAYNADFANNLGNLVSRLAAVSKKVPYGIHVERNSTFDVNKLNQILSNYELQAFAQTLWNRLSTINAEINRTKPWELVKAESHQQVKELLAKWADEVFAVASLLSCFIPGGAEAVRNVLECGLDRLDGPLFPRIEGERNNKI